MFDVPFIIPALNAEKTLESLVTELRQAIEGAVVIVVDDGSSDETGARARAAGALVVRHSHNLGKGAALLSGLRFAEGRGARTAVSLDADGQHAVADAVKLARHEAADEALVLGVRDLRRANAPKANRFSNRLSNNFLSAFSGQQLLDTQCGLRRYPVAATLNSGVRASGFAFESELVLVAALRGWSIVHVPVDVHYPPEEQRITHFRNVVDPAKIVVRVVASVASHHWSRWRKTDSRA